MWWFMPLARLRQNNLKLEKSRHSIRFKASLGYRVKSYLKK